MRVKSPIADIDFVIGEIRRDGDALVINGDPSSTIDAEIRMTPRDAAQMLRAFLFNPAAIGYFLSLPFLFGKNGAAGDKAAGEARDPFVRLNNPW